MFSFFQRVISELPRPITAKLRHMIGTLRAQSTLAARHFCPKIWVWTRNTLDCDQSNYFSRIVFSHIPIEFGQTGNSAIRSRTPKTTPRTKHEVDRTTPRRDMAIWNFQNWEVGRWLVAGRSVGPQYILLLTVISYTPLRYVRNVAREE